MDEPELTFSPWLRWRDRTQLITDEPRMAVYLWARFDQSPPSTAAYPQLWPNVIYVGETNDLNARLLRDERHQRIAVYRDVFADDPNCERLFVSVSTLPQPFRPKDAHC